MRAALALAAGLLVAAGASALVSNVLAPADAHGAHDAHASHEDMAGMPTHEPPQAAPEDFSWSSPDGTLPDANDQSLRELSSFQVRGDQGLAQLAAKGFLKGHGTRSDPWIIEGLKVDGNLDLRDLTGYTIVRHNVVGGQLKLNYIGHLLHVHHNRIHDLRINENVQRTGNTSGGLVEHNAIAFIGQMRHFEGEFRLNQVGPKDSGPFADALGDTGPLRFDDAEVWNFDGFNEANVHDNQVVGEVEIKLHGHEHASCFTCVAHDHGSMVGKDEGVDHQDRYTSLVFAHNAIQVPEGSGPALLYRDTDHAGDDRTATSEPNPELDLPHVHHTHVDLVNNQLTGGGMVLRVFGASDPRHLEGSDGLLRIDDNTVTFPAPAGLGGALAGPAGGTGFDLHDANGTRLELERNTVLFQSASGAPMVPGMPSAASQASGIGILLRDWVGSDLALQGNVVRGAHVGVEARAFDGATHWALASNTWDADVPVDYDGSVANPPG